jgi:hypothetical protein
MRLLCLRFPSRYLKSDSGDTVWSSSSHRNQYSQSSGTRIRHSKIACPHGWDSARFVETASGVSRG